MATRRYLAPLLVSAAIAGGFLAGSFPSLQGSLVTEANAAPVVQDVLNQPSFADIFARVSPAVVNISVSKSGKVHALSGRPGQPMTPYGDAPLEQFFGHFFEMPNGPPQGMPSQALGSGLIIDSNGYVVTNNHVIESADTITVTLEDGSELVATLVGTDPKTDIALLKVSPDAPLTSVKLGDSDAARVGDWVLAIGNPFGLGGTATFGIISAIGRDIQSGPYDNYLQIDAAINSGNSGGPVFNVAGEVIGVNTAIFSPNGGNVGIGFAIPATQVQKIADALKDDGHVTRGWLGVQIQEIDKDLAENLGMDTAKGAMVANVVAGSPAEHAHVKVGDVITAIDGQVVDSPKSLSRLIADANPNRKVRITVLRGGDEKHLSVQLGEADEPATLAANDGNGRDNPASAEKLGLSLTPLTATIREQLGIDDDVTGLVVAGVDPGSPASLKGIRRGDVILSVDGKNLDSFSDFEAAVASARAPEHSVRMLVRRGDNQRFVALGLA
jgi:serine protease Do